MVLALAVAVLAVAVVLYMKDEAEMQLSELVVEEVQERLL